MDLLAIDIGWQTGSAGLPECGQVSSQTLKISLFRLTGSLFVEEGYLGPDGDMKNNVDSLCVKIIDKNRSTIIHDLWPKTVGETKTRNPRGLC